MSIVQSGIVGYAINRACRVGVSLMVAGMLFSQAGWGQDRTFPGPRYDEATRWLAAGNYTAASGQFRRALEATDAPSETPWIDRVCGLALSGEAAYRLGDISTALEHFDAAISLATQQHGWLSTLQAPPALVAAKEQTIVHIPWGKPEREAMQAAFPSNIPARLPPAVTGPGVGRPATAPLRVDEVTRCLGLALRRKTEILGPEILGSLAARQETFRSLVELFRGEDVTAASWLPAFRAVLVSAALRGSGDSAGAYEEAMPAILTPNQLFHPLSATALLILAESLADEGRWQLAADQYWEATLLAAAYGQSVELEDAFRGYRQMLQRLQRPLPVDVFLAAAKWGRDQRMYRLQAELLLAVVEADLSQPLPAAGAASPLHDPSQQALLTTIGKLISSPGMEQSDVAAQYHLLVATRQYLAGQPTASASLDLALHYERRANLQGLRIAQVDDAYRTGKEVGDSAVELYRYVLAEPTDDDWRTSPGAALARTTTQYPQAMHHWFEAAWQAGRYDQAWEVAERIRASRFHASLQLGGRLLALRWFMHEPAASNDAANQDLRTHWLARFPDWKQNKQELDQLTMRWRSAKPSEHVGLFRTWLSQGETLIARQESLLHAMAISRTGAVPPIPQVRTLEQVRGSLPAGHVVLTFLQTEDALYGMLVAPQPSDDEYWRIDDVPAVRARLTTLLRELGVLDGAVTLTQLKSDAWQHLSSSLVRMLLSDKAYQVIRHSGSLTIVPDSFLWFVPFGACRLARGAETREVSLNEAWEWRVLPTLGIPHQPSDVAPQPGAPDAINDRLGHRLALAAKGQETQQRQLEWMGPTFTAPPDPDSLLSLPLKPVDVWRMRTSLSFLAMDDLGGTGQAVVGTWYDTLLRGAGRSGGIDGWFAFPRCAPQSIALLGLPTAAEYGLTSDSQGDAMFLTTCGLMASGSQTILLNQWRTRGRTAVELAREFLLEVPHRPAADAWRRSLDWIESHDLDLTQEPQVRSASPGGASVERVSGKVALHPYLAAGYLVIDNRPFPPQQVRPNDQPPHPAVGN